MHHRRDDKANALRCKHQRGKARKKIDKAADHQDVAPVQNRQRGFAAPPAAQKIGPARLLHYRTWAKKYTPALTMA